MKNTGIDLSSNIENLWSMKPDEFNQWRRENDLPILFDYFKEFLPGFNEWLAEHNITKEIFLEVVPTGALFKGDNDQIYYDVSIEGKKNIYVRDIFFNEQRFKDRCKKENIEIKKCFIFKPYLLWGKKKFKKDKFIFYDEANNQRSGTFVYTLWSVINLPQASRAHLFKQFKVLKLGGIKIGERITIGGKNLDFTDLDNLTINERFHGSRWTNISFSSCRNLVFDEAEISFFEFNDCHIEDINFNKSKIQDFKFINSTIQGFKLQNTYTNRLSFEKTVLSGLDIYRCELINFLYKSPKASGYEREFNNYRKIRLAFQQEGKRNEAKHFYYYERCFERKKSFSPYLANRNLFPPMTKYAGRFRDIWSHFRNGHFTLKKAIFFNLYLIGYYVNIWINPFRIYFWRALRFKVIYFISLFEYILWGYGERPIRPLLIGSAIIMLYSLVYYYSIHPDLNKSLINSIYFSIVTFTTLGYGDISPKNYDELKIICSSEALLGIILVAILVAGFANRSKY